MVVCWKKSCFPNIDHWDHGQVQSEIISHSKKAGYLSAHYYRPCRGFCDPMAVNRNLRH